MSTAHNPIRLFETVIDECPYLPDERAASILVDPDHKISPALFGMLSRSGFRRSGEMLYSPKCPTCNACISVRIAVDEFTPSKSQKRVWKKNQDLNCSIKPVSFKESHFELYLKYQRARHPESSMCDEDTRKYTSFVDSYFSDSRVITFKVGKKLIGVTIIDQFIDGISAVYTYFDPEQAHRSIGTYAILYLIKIARLREIPYVYLGYWVKGSQKMDYKRKFKPLEGYIERNWRPLD